MRGSMSFIDSRLNFGLGEENVIDTLIIVWPDRKRTIKTDIKANQFLSFSEENGTLVKGNKNKEISKIQDGNISESFSNMKASSIGAKPSYRFHIIRNLLYSVDLVSKVKVEFESPSSE